MKTIEEKNQIIKEFMRGYDFEHTEGGLPLGDFSNSWEWLMPVISNLSTLATPDSKMRSIIQDWNFNFLRFSDGDIYVCGPIKDAYNDVVNLIEWYNKNK